MAKKSKTQKAKASAARAAKKAQAAQEETVASEEVVATEPVEEEPKKLTRAEKKAAKQAEATAASKQAQPAAKKDTKKPEKKKRFKFLREVRQELKRVTWPDRQDVGRWSLVVVGALVFFGVYVLVLDNLIVSPILYGISSLGA